MKKSAAPLPPFRPPAVPLVTHDPYFSAWAFSETLNAEWFHHWTGAGRGICGLLRVDGRAWTFLGLNPVPGATAMEQRSLEVTPTRTIAVFAAGGIELTVTFCSPLLPHNLELLSRPVTYVTLALHATDGNAHAVQAFLGGTGEWATDQCEEAVTWARFQLPGLTVMSIGAANQQVLNRAGDNHRANWGQFYLAAPAGAGVSSAMGLSTDTRGTFAATGALPAADSLDLPRPVTDGWPGLNLAFDLGRVGKTAVSRFAMLAYDDLFALEYLHRRVRAWWRRDGQDAAGLLITAAADYARVTRPVPLLTPNSWLTCAPSAARNTPASARWPFASASRRTNWRRIRRFAALHVQGKFFKRLHQHRGRHLSVGAVFSPPQPRLAEGADYPHSRLRPFSALEIPLCPP